MGEQRVKPSHIIRDVVQKQGLRGFYQGYFSVFLRESTQMGLYFLAYEVAKEWFQARNGGKDTIVGLLSAGAIAGMYSPNLLCRQLRVGVAGWTSNYPVDVIKTRMQSSNDYNSVGAAVRAIYATEVLFFLLNLS